MFISALAFLFVNNLHEYYANSTFYNGILINNDEPDEIMIV